MSHVDDTSTGRPRVDVESYAWFDDADENPWTGDPFSVAVITGASLDQVVAAYAAELVGQGSFDDPSAGDDPLAIAQVDTPSGDAVVVVETGIRSALDEVARAASAAGALFTAYVDDALDSDLVVQYRDGVCLARFEPGVDTEPSGEDDEVYPDWALGWEMDLDEAVVLGLCLIEQASGIRVEPDWYERSWPLYTSTIPAM